jgi:hypothetical protein
VYLRGIIGYLQKLLYTVNRIRMLPTPTLNIYLFEDPILYSIVLITTLVNGNFNNGVVIRPTVVHQVWTFNV